MINPPADFVARSGGLHGAREFIAGLLTEADTRGFDQVVWAALEVNVGAELSKRAHTIGTAPTNDGVCRSQTPGGVWRNIAERGVGDSFVSFPLYVDCDPHSAYLPMHQ